MQIRDSEAKERQQRSANEYYAQEYQRWLWIQAERIQAETEKNLRSMWTHEDRQRGNELGFMMTFPPQTKGERVPIELFSLIANYTGHDIYLRIKAMADMGDALCKKVIAILVAEKFRFPDHTFNHEEKGAG